MLSKRALLKTSLKLTRIHDCVPRCLMLKGFKKTGDYPFALGHFGELWRGQVEGMEVAVKQARVFTSDNNINKVLRVGCYRFIHHDNQRNISFTATEARSHHLEAVRSSQCPTFLWHLSRFCPFYLLSRVAIHGQRISSSIYEQNFGSS